MKTAVHTWLLALALSLAPLTGGAQDAPADTSAVVVDSIVIERSLLTQRDFRSNRTFLPCRIGLALSGGGARGIAQVGVLKAFDEAGFDVYCIAGTSMGSVIGGLYASGYSAEDIQGILRRVNFSTLFSDSPQRRSLFVTQREEQERYLVSIRLDGIKPYIPSALTAGQRLTSLLTDLTIRADYNHGGDFDLLPIPFRAVATDVGTGQEVVIGKGSLADAMRASMAFPLAFTPVEQDGRYLFDGGIVDPLPVHVCRTMGAEYVVAVNTVSTLLPAEKVDNPIDVAGQVTTIMSQAALAEQLREADYIIDPLLNDLELFNFGMHDTLVARGYRAGRRATADIESDLQQAACNGGMVISAVRTARQDSCLEQLRQDFPVAPGQTFSTRIVREALAYADRGMRFHRLEAMVAADGGGMAIILDGQPNRPCRDIVYDFVGNSVLNDSQLTTYFPSEGDSALSLTAVHTAADSVIAHLRRTGYDLAHVTSIRYNHDSARVTITIDEGLLDYVDIRGNARTRSWIIKADYPLRPGEPFNVRKSEKGLADIYATGFFERVSLDIEPTDGGTHLTINVKEKKFTQLRLGAHWDDEYQAEMFAQLLDDNVLGAGIQVLGHAHLSSRRNQYHLSIKANRLSRTLISAHTRFYFSRLHRRLFQSDGAPFGYRIEDRLGWSIMLGQQIARLGVIDVQYRLEDITTRQTLTDQTRDHVLSAFAVTSTVETLNKFPYPDYGHRQDLAVEFTGKWLGGTFDEFTKLSGSIEAYLPVTKFINLHPRFAAGLSTADLPEIEKFYLGGMYNFSGYRTDQLAGDKFFITNLQLRLKLPYRFYLLGDFDYGNVFDDYENIKIKDFRKGWGAAVSIDTPFGPVDFGYGNAEVMPWRLYLNVGLRF